MIGRVDYSVRAVDQNSQEELFNISYSSLKILDKDMKLPAIGDQPALEESLRPSSLGIGLDPHRAHSIAKTDPNSKYTHIVAESDYFEDFMEGWEYTLRHFIEEYKEAVQQHPKEEYLKRCRHVRSHIDTQGAYAVLRTEADVENSGSPIV